MPDEFGGVDVDEFGGLPVDAPQTFAQKFGKSIYGANAVSIPMSSGRSGPITPESVAAADRPLSTAEKVATWPLGFEAQGMQQFGQGLSRVAHPQSKDDFAGGASDIVRGGMTIAAPFAASAMLAHPIRTAASIAAGSIAGQGAETGSQFFGAGPGTSEAIGTGVGALAGGLTARATAPGPIQVDSPNAAIRAWKFESDPWILKQMRAGGIKLESGLSDLKANGQIKGPYVNESVLENAPKVMEQNRNVWQMWMNRARGQFRDGNPIIQATADSLKHTISDPRAQAIMAEAQRIYGRLMSPEEMAQLLEEKNGELKSFYSSDEGVRAAAEQAGGDTLKSKALLEAQASALRDMLYKTLDPEGQGAGPAEVQARYGAVRSIEEAANKHQKDFITSHPLNKLESAANFRLDPRAYLKSKFGDPEWLAFHAVNSAADAAPLPTPRAPFYPTNESMPMPPYGRPTGPMGPTMGAPGISSTNPAGLITPKQSPPPTIQQTIQPAQSPPAIAPPPRLLGSRRGSFSPKPTRQPAAEQADIDFQQRYGQQEQPGVAQHIGHTVEQRITDAYNQLDQGGGNTVTMYRLKQALPDVPKDQFDQAVLRMTNGQDAPFLGAVHDSASRMPESVRSDFVYDPAARESSTAPLGSGAYYVSMYKRPPSEPLAQRMGRQVWQALGGPKIGGQ